MARVNSSNLDHDLQCNGLLVALTVAAALGMLAISLLWPYLLAFVLSIEQAAPSTQTAPFRCWEQAHPSSQSMLLFTASKCTAL
jgi:hypothetical protein